LCTGGGCAGDIVGCAVNLDDRTMSFSVNGSFEAPMGMAFAEFNANRGLYPCMSISHGETVTVNLGGTASSARRLVSASHDEFGRLSRDFL
jgi:hypothetical protein